jgi:hypothetical protein
MTFLFNTSDRKEKPLLLLDTTKKVDNSPVSTLIVLGRPWIMNFIEMIMSANALDRLVILAEKDEIEKLRVTLSDYVDTSGLAFITSDQKLKQQYKIIDIKYLYWRRLFLKAIHKNSYSFENAIFFRIDESGDFKIAEDFSGRESAGHGTWILRYIYRPLGSKLAQLLVNTKVTPNAITTISFLSVIIASLFITFNNYTFDIISALLLNLFIICDVADGVLARLRRQNSEFGYWYDTMVDKIHDVVLIYGFIVSIMIEANIDLINIALGAAWIVGYSALSSNQLISKAAWAKSPKADLKKSLIAGTNNLKGIIRGMTRLMVNITGNAEVVLISYTLALVLNLKAELFYVFSFIYG